MKTPNRDLKEAGDICRNSGLYQFLSREEKKEAILYCASTIEKSRSASSRGGKL